MTNAQTAFDRVLALCGVVEQPVTDVGNGIRVASAVDPFDTLLSMIENPHFGGDAVAKSG